MNQKSIKLLLAQLSTASDNNIDKSICIKLKGLSRLDFVTSAQVKEILDECVYAGLASSFSIGALHLVWNELLKNNTIKD